MRYKAPYNNGEVSEFDPGSEIICPLCGDVQPTSPGWQTHTTIVICRNEKHPGSTPAIFDINCFIDDEDPQRSAYLISIGQLFEEDVREWLAKRTQWSIQSLLGDPQWMVEPEPTWRARIKEAVASTTMTLRRY